MRAHISIPGGLKHALVSMMRGRALAALCALGLAVPEPARACDPECAAAIAAGAEDALSRDQSVAAGRNNAVVLQHGAGIPVLTCRPLMFCSIRLEPGEILLEDLALGDTVLWSAEMRVAGTQADPHIRILVKPDAAATETSLVIATDRRFYDIRLVKSDDRFTPVMAFTYPADVAAATRARIAEQAQVRADRDRAAAVDRAVEEARQSLPVNGRDVFAGDLDFGFTVSGTAPFKPVRVFTDGARTWIDLPPRYRGERPVFLAGRDGLVNTRWRRLEDSPRATRLEIDRVIAEGRLMIGVGRSAQVIIIRRDRR